MTEDRTIHAKFTHEREVFHIVRYDRAGKWWVESPTSRRPVTVAQAVATATAFDATVYFGLSGGSAFDRQMKLAMR